MGEGEVKSLHLFDPIPGLGFRVHFFHFKRGINLSSIAQEESRTISENVKWGKRVSYKNGNVSFAYSHFLGYKKEDDKIVIDKAQAVVVRQIYQWFLRDGLTYNAIAARLIDAGVKTPGGKDKWMANNILSILTNEKYKGDAIL